MHLGIHVQNEQRTGEITLWVWAFPTSQPIIRQVFQIFVYNLRIPTSRQWITLFTSSRHNHCRQQCMGWSKRVLFTKDRSLPCTRLTLYQQIGIEC